MESSVSAHTPQCWWSNVAGKAQARKVFYFILDFAPGTLKPIQPILSAMRDGSQHQAELFRLFSVEPAVDSFSRRPSADGMAGH
jgi:hypothetical protein